MQIINNIKTKLKIAQVIDVFEDSSNGGAISTQRFTDLLRNDGHRVIVLSTGKKLPDKIVLKEFYLPFYLKKIMQRMKFVFAKPDKSIFYKTFSKVDIVHNQFPLLLGIIAVSVAKKMHKPIVSTYHVQGEQLMHNAGLKHPFFTKLSYKWFMRFIYNKSDIVICPSEFAQQEIKRYGCKSKTIVISNGVTDDYQPLSIAKKYPDKFTILTVGRNALEKRQELLIRAVAASKYKNKIQLIILGDGPLRQNLESLSNELLDGNVEFKLLPTNEVINYYNTSDLYVHTANIEVECMTALEAMACGLPLLIADAPLSATKQFALNNKFLFKTVAELTDKINYWLENRAELEQAKEDYLELSKQYNIEQSYQKLLHVYNLALAMHEEKEVQITEQLQEA
jgi:glycosyltransferase involved in cell wall biosynthesis